MRRICVGRSRSIFLILLVLSGLLPGLDAGAAHADLLFAKTAVDLGDARSGLPLKHTFAFVNNGREAVAITDLRPGCGCLVPRLAKRVYTSGESGEVFLEINTLAQPAGPHTWSLQVMYRRGEQPAEASLHLNANIVHEISVQPAAIVVFADSGVEHDITFTDTRARPLTITGFRSTSPHLTARVAEGGRDAQGHRTCKIHLQLDDGFSEGRHEELLHIDTNDSLYRDLRVAVTIVKKPRTRVAAFPSELTWTAAGSTALPSQLVRLRDAKDEAVMVERIASDDPALSCRWAAGPGAMATVKIGVDPVRLGVRDIDATVHIDISKPVRETIALPVVIRK